MAGGDDLMNARTDEVTPDSYRVLKPAGAVVSWRPPCGGGNIRRRAHTASGSGLRLRIRLSRVRGFARRFGLNRARRC